MLIVVNCKHFHLWHLCDHPKREKELKMFKKGCLKVKDFACKCPLFEKMDKDCADVYPIKG